MFELFFVVLVAVVIVVVLIIGAVAWIIEQFGSKKSVAAVPRAASSPTSRVSYGSRVSWQASSPYGLEPDFEELVDELMSDGYSRDDAEWEAEERLQGFEREKQLLPNGYTLADYERHGISQDEVEFWGLDQPGAPPPDTAGWVVWDMVDGMGW